MIPIGAMARRRILMLAEERNRKSSGMARLAMMQAARNTENTMATFPAG